jgi:hypothetical protein
MFRAVFDRRFSEETGVASEIVIPSGSEESAFVVMMMQ